MAIYTPGPLAGAISGSIGGSVYSHNRGGPYIRSRHIPVNPATITQLLTRTEMIQASIMWQSRTPANQLQWRTWADNNPIPNALGNMIRLTGHQAFVQIMAWRFIAGWDPGTYCPTHPCPAPFFSLSLVADIGAGGVKATFTPTPTGVDKYFVLWAAVVDSPGISYVKNLWKLCSTSSLNAASPLDIKTFVEDKWGLLQVGNVLWIKCEKLLSPDGVRSAPLIAKATVITT